MFFSYPENTSLARSFSLPLCHQYHHKIKFLLLVQLHWALAVMSQHLENIHKNKHALEKHTSTRTCDQAVIEINVPVNVGGSLRWFQSKFLKKFC